MKLNTILGTVAAATLATAQQPVSYDAGNDISFKLSVPQETAQSGNGDFYFQMSGPTTNSWISMGIGGGMQGNSLFVMYEDGAGNVTVSPRLGVGFVQPAPNPQAQLELLEGSGVTDGMMVANVRCSDCTTWGNGRSIDFSSPSATFVHANRMGAALDSTSSTERIQQHQVNGQEFTFDLTQAILTSAASNPFATYGGQGQQSGGSQGGPLSGAPSGAGGQGSSSSGGRPPSNIGTILLAHGVIMGLTVVLLIPLGALIMRLAPVPWWLHGGIQVLFLFLLTAGFGLGYYFSQETMQLYMGDAYTHTVFGTVIFAFFWLQPFLGYAHHLMYKRKGQRTAVSHVHIWWGRIVMILAIINGGLGLQLAGNTRGGEIAYGVIAGLIGLLYIAGAVFGELSRSKKSSNVSAEK